MQIQGIDNGKRYYAIGWGIRQDQNFAGSAEDELFVILKIDQTLTRIEHVFEFIPTPRWLDYAFRIDQITGDSVIVTGKGQTYADDPRRRAYPRPEAQ